MTIKNITKFNRNIRSCLTFSNKWRSILSHINNRKLHNTTINSNNLNQNKVTVNVEEVEKFGAMSAEWWDPYGNFKLLHQMNLPRIQYLLDNLTTNKGIGDQYDPTMKANSNTLKDLKVLDVGCGGGLLSESLARLGAKVTAIDASEKNIAIANLHKRKDPLLNDVYDRLQYFCKTSHELLEEKGEGYFDIVCSFEVIEHVNSPSEFIDSLSGLVKKEGKVFLSTINRNLLSYFLTKMMAEYILKLTPIGTHDYEKYITPDELANYITCSNLKLDNLSNISYNPIKSKWELGPDMFPKQPSQDFAHLFHTQFPVNYMATATKL